MANIPGIETLFGMDTPTDADSLQNFTATEAAQKKAADQSQRKMQPDEMLRQDGDATDKTIEKMELQQAKDEASFWSDNIGEVLQMGAGAILQSIAAFNMNPGAFLLGSIINKTAANSIDAWQRAAEQRQRAIMGMAIEGQENTGRDLQTAMLLLQNAVRGRDIPAEELPGIVRNIMGASNIEGEATYETLIAAAPGLQKRDVKEQFTEEQLKRLIEESTLGRGLLQTRKDAQVNELEGILLNRETELRRELGDVPEEYIQEELIKTATKHQATKGDQNVLPPDEIKNVIDRQLQTGITAAPIPEAKKKEFSQGVQETKVSGSTVLIQDLGNFLPSDIRRPVRVHRKVRRSHVFDELPQGKDNFTPIEIGNAIKQWVVRDARLGEGGYLVVDTKTRDIDYTKVSPFVAPPSRRDITYGPIRIFTEPFKSEVGMFEAGLQRGIEQEIDNYFTRYGMGDKTVFTEEFMSFLRPLIGGILLNADSD